MHDRDRAHAVQHNQELSCLKGDANMYKEQPFRVQLIFYDEMKSVQAVPLNGLPNSVGDETTGAMLHGRDDVTSFAAGIGIDSIVQTKQLSDQPLVLERT